MVLHIRLFTLARPPDPPAHVTFHLKLCMRVQIWSINNKGLFDPLKSLQLYGLKIKFHVVLYKSGMESIFKITDLHARNYFVIMMKKMCRMFLSVPIAYISISFFPPDINLRKEKENNW